MLAWCSRWKKKTQLQLEDRASYLLSKTKQYDREASMYLSYVLYPLVRVVSLMQLAA